MNDELLTLRNKSEQLGYGVRYLTDIKNVDSGATTRAVCLYPIHESVERRGCIVFRSAAEAIKYCSR